MALARVQRLSRETHPSVERGCPFFATSARLDSDRVRDPFDDIAEAYLLFFDETGKAYAMRLVFTFTCWFFLFLGVHGSFYPLSTVYPLLSMTW
jgi:hypothetical protein